MSAGRRCRVTVGEVRCDRITRATSSARGSPLASSAASTSASASRRGATDRRRAGAVRASAVGAEALGPVADRVPPRCRRCRRPASTRRRGRRSVTGHTGSSTTPSRGPRWPGGMSRTSSCPTTSGLGCPASRIRTARRPAHRTRGRTGWRRSRRTPARHQHALHGPEGPVRVGPRQDEGAPPDPEGDAEGGLVGAVAAHVPTTTRTVPSGSSMASKKSPPSRARRPPAW